MGQTLSEPVTAKESSSCANKDFIVGSSCMQGWRMNMEDCHTQLLSLPGDEEASFFGVYDGHGGCKVAQYAGMRLHEKIVEHPEYGKGDLVEVMKKAFVSLDNDMMNDEETKDELAGSTAICVLIKNGKIFCGNCGDSRGVMCVKGRAIPLSSDHKPSNESETKRIVAAGGWVEFNRVNGNLALSRALGDFVFKRNDNKTPEEQIVTASPDVTIHELNADVEFIILACDGIWDVLSNQEVIDFIRCRMATRMEPEYICEQLMMRCLASERNQLGNDNMTVVLICPLHGGTYDDVAELLAKRCRRQRSLRKLARKNASSASICEELMTRCLAPDCQMGGLGCDNMTVVLICPLHGATYDEVAERCSRPSVVGHHHIIDESTRAG